MIWINENLYYEHLAKVKAMVKLAMLGLPTEGVCQISYEDTINGSLTRCYWCLGVIEEGSGLVLKVNDKIGCEKYPFHFFHFEDRKISN